MQATDHWGACTTRAIKARVGPWQSRDLLRRSARNERLNPRPRTTDTPICRAWRSHPRCTGAATRSCDPFVVQLAEVEEAGRHRAILLRCSGNTVWTKVDHRSPGASHCVHQQKAVRI